MIEHETEGLRALERDELDPKSAVRFFRSFDYDHTVEFWSWMHSANPSGESTIHAVTNGEEIVAYFAFLPVALEAQSERVNAALGVHLAAKPGLPVPALIGFIDSAVRKARKRGIQLVFGFPNDNSWPVLSRFCGWENAGPVVAWEATEVEPHHRSRDDPRTAIREPVFTDVHATLSNRNLADGLHPVRSVDHLNWRYRDHPLQNYTLVEHRRGGQLRGFLVTKEFMRADGLHLQILESGAHDPSPSLLRSLLVATCRETRTDVDKITCWMSPRALLSASLEKLGFQRRGFKTNLGYKVLDPTCPDPATSWALTMGDSDAF